MPDCFLSRKEVAACPGASKRLVGEEEMNRELSCRGSGLSGAVLLASEHYVPHFIERKPGNL